MEEKEVINNQPAPNVEKVSLKDIKKEKQKEEEPETENIASKLVEALKTLDAEGIRQVTAYVDKKIDILKKLK